MVFGMPYGSFDGFRIFSALLPKLVPDKVEGLEVAAQRSQGDLWIQAQLLEIFSESHVFYQILEISGEISRFVFLKN